MKNTYEKVSEIINSVADIGEMEQESFLKEDLGLDSLSLVEICVRLEEEFSIEFNSDELNPDEILQVRDLVALVEKSI